MLWQQRSGGNVWVFFALEGSTKKKKAGVMKDSQKKKKKQLHTPNTLKLGFCRAEQKQFAVITIV